MQLFSAGWLSLVHLCILTDRHERCYNVSRSLADALLRISAQPPWKLYCLRNEASSYADLSTRLKALTRLFLYIRLPPRRSSWSAPGRPRWLPSAVFVRSSQHSIVTETETPISSASAAPQEQLVRSLEAALAAPTIPPETVTALLNLAEFMEHDDKRLPLDTRTLGALAEKCHAFAKVRRRTFDMH